MAETTTIPTWSAVLVEFGDGLRVVTSRLRIAAVKIKQRKGVHVADTVNILSLCSGVGMLDLGVCAGLDYLGLASRHVGYCERDAYAAACLLARMEDSSLEPAPVFCGDLRDLDARPLRGCVDLVCAGLPCQPYSVAGKRRGNADERSHGGGDGPIPHFLRIVAECRPALVFLENVPPWVRGGFFRPVGEELCRLGYTIESPLFITAESVGASHRRERVFVLAYRQGERWWDIQRDSESGTAGDDERADGGCEAMAVARSVQRRFGKQRRGQDRGGASGGTGDELGNAGGERREAWNVAVQRSRDKPTAGQADDAGEGRGYVADAHEQGPQERIGERGDERKELAAAERGGPVCAPGPAAEWSGIEPHLWPATEPGLRVLADGRTLVVDASRADQLRCAGNGCVPAQAAVAFVELVRRIKQRTTRHDMVSRDLGNGFRAVPLDAVTLNGMPLPQLNAMVEPYSGYWHVIAPNGRAVDGENGRPHLYRTIGEAAEDAARLAGLGEYSTCK